MEETFERLVRRGLLTGLELKDIRDKAEGSAIRFEQLLRMRELPKHELLHCLAETYGCPFVEYDESVIVSQQVLRSIDAERLKCALWFPLSIRGTFAQVVAWDPGDPSTVNDIKNTLKVTEIEFLAALPSDLVRIIEHNQDINPAFAPSAGRTPLAKARTYLADRRSLFASTRTTLARGRTGLAFLRTGMSFITIAVLLYRIFGAGLLSIIEIALFSAGAIMAVDGIRWYLPARRTGHVRLSCQSPEPANGSTVLQGSWRADEPVFSRSETVEGARESRAGWDGLSPVMRRRFLASDRTDYAEERTALACLRTKMAMARTGLAFTRSGIAFIGLGIGLLRQFPGGYLDVFDVLLILAGAAMTLEGLYWYLPGRRAGEDGLSSVKRSETNPSIWESLFPPTHKRPVAERGLSCMPAINAGQAPGIWATTGLALERTVLAERRNVMARLRTIMARSRTGLAIVRTGLSTSAVGAGLLVLFGSTSWSWAAFTTALIGSGLALIADGLYWHLPAENIRKQFPFCFCDVEIAIPDYGRPARFWPKAVFSHDDL